MKLYCVMHCYWYEGDELCGVFSTFDKAKEQAIKIINRKYNASDFHYNGESTWTLKNSEDYSIEEHILDEPY